MSCLPALDFYRSLFRHDVQCEESKGAPAFAFTTHTSASPSILPVPVAAQQAGTHPGTQQAATAAQQAGQQALWGASPIVPSHSISPACDNGTAARQQENGLCGHYSPTPAHFQAAEPHQQHMLFTGHPVAEAAWQQHPAPGMQNQRLLLTWGQPAAASQGQQQPLSHAHPQGSAHAVQQQLWQQQAAFGFGQGNRGDGDAGICMPAQSVQASWAGSQPCWQPFQQRQPQQRQLQKSQLHSMRAPQVSRPATQHSQQQSQQHWQQRCPKQQRPAHAAATGNACAAAEPARSRPAARLLHKLAAEPAEAEGCDGVRWPWLAQDRRDAQLRRPGDPDYDPSTLHIPPRTFSGKPHSFVEQFWRLKARCMDLVLFVRHGSFYNLFDIDADIGLRIGLQISGKRTANMWKVGCHHNYFPAWAAKVLSLGYSVGRVEEVRSSSSSSSGKQQAGSKELLRRELVRIYTPGTAVDGLVAEAGGQEARPMLCIVVPSPGLLGCCVLDVASAQSQVGCFEDTADRSQLAMLLLQHDPVEVVAPRHSLSASTLAAIKCHCRTTGTSSTTSRAGPGTSAQQGVALTLLPKSAVSADAQQLLQRQLPCDQLQELQQLLVSCSWQAGSAALQAVALAVRALQRCSIAGDVLPSLQFAALAAEHEKHKQQGPRHMLLDDRAVVTLELLQGALGDTTGSLLAFLDRTTSAPGKRLLRAWLLKPIVRSHEVEERLHVVQALMQFPKAAAQLQAQLKQLPDCERLLPKAAKALRDMLPRKEDQEHQAQQGFEGMVEPLWCDEGDPADGQWVAEAQRATWEAVGKLVQGLSGYVAVVANLREHFVSADSPAAHLPLLERALLAAAYCTTPLSSLSATLEQQQQQEGAGIETMAEAAQLFLGSYRSFTALQVAVAELDILAGFAAATHPSAAPPGCSFCRPTFVDGAVQQPAPVVNAAGGSAAVPSVSNSNAGTSGSMPAINGSSRAASKAACDGSSSNKTTGSSSSTTPLMQFIGLWHPLLASRSHAVMPNDVHLGGGHSGAMLLTGANSGGKSTLLRAVCIATIMAQLGCYVACKQATLSAVDACFVRIGAHDSIMSGNSTFMVEMAETSRALACAGPNSLVVLDELGRGTSTFDGYAIAYAVLRHLAGTVRCRVLFATHYHRLAAEAEVRQVCQMAHMASLVQAGAGFVPLFQLRAGPVPEGSCGIEVAAGAGVPQQVVQRAAQMAAAMERRTLAAGAAGSSDATCSAC